MQEKTYYLYKSQNIRLQFVVISSKFTHDLKYEIRMNRKILLRTGDHFEALSYFRGKIYEYVSQLNLFSL